MGQKQRLHSALKAKEVMILDDFCSYVDLQKLHQVPDRGNDQEGADPLPGPRFRARGCYEDSPPEPLGLVRPMLGE
eukprot:Skav235189  [mRNA]  locus=scaffold1938:16869:17527:+ [translate_table: standard]